MKKMMLGVALAAWVGGVAAAVESPYADEQGRDIKAMSAEEIDAYLAGKGMGLAQAAELNHYPGPRHVLDMARELELSDTQTAKTQELFDRMQARAIELGHQIVERERELDRMFAEGTVDANTLEQALLHIGTLQARLRNVHLSAHLEQKALLTKHQVMLYDRLRGYGAGQSSGHDHSH